MSEIDYDVYGRCCKCHRNLMTDKFFNNSWHKVFAEREEQEFDLSDGTKMRVTLCKSCKSQLSDKDSDEIMQSVIKGWEKEVNSFSHWSVAKKKEHMSKYKSLKIKGEKDGVSKQKLHV